MARVVLSILFCSCFVICFIHGGGPPDNPCGQTPCENGGTCVVNGKRFWCSCSEEYYGNRCEKLSPCGLGNPCENGGTCARVYNEPGYSCLCTSQHTGINCTKVSPCVSMNPCLNGGACRTNRLVAAGYHCYCNGGYVGLNCEKVGSYVVRPVFPTSTCTPNNPCLNGGECLQQSTDRVRCVCPQGFTGEWCGRVVSEDPCTRNPCQNGGSCSSQETAQDQVTCTCAAGFTGQRCQHSSGPSCPAVGNCTGTCFYGRSKDSRGCPTCLCSISPCLTSGCQDGCKVENVCDTKDGVRQCTWQPKCFNASAGCRETTASGRCQALTPRYFYNTTLQACQSYKQGQCGTNSNNFETMENCNVNCFGITGTPPPTQGSLSGGREGRKPSPVGCPVVPMCTVRCLYGHKIDDRGCMTCDCRASPCKTANCSGGCRDVRECATKQGERKCTWKTQCFDAAAGCREARVVGQCRALIPRYFYNSTSGVCAQFNYGGCGANNNNFETKENCEDNCRGSLSRGREGRKPAPVGSVGLRCPVVPMCTVRCVYGHKNDDRGCMTCDCKASPCKTANCSGGCRDVHECETKDGQHKCTWKTRCFDASRGCFEPRLAGACTAFMKTRFLFNSTSNSCETFYDGGCGSNNNNFETRENCEDNCKGRVQRPIPPGETEVPPEKSIVSSCANNPCHNGASCIVTQQSSRGYICQCTSGYSGVNCDQAVQAVPCVLSNPCQHGGSCNSWRDRVTNEWRYACACTDMYEGDHCEQESACGKIPCLNGGTCQLDREGKPYCLCTRDFAGKNCTEENPCNTENICKNGGTCNSWRDQVTSNWAHNCKCTDLYSGTSCDVANACATYSCRNGGTCRSSLQGNPFCSCTQEYRGTFCETKICPQNYTECFSNKRFSLSNNFTECRAQVFEEYTKTSQCLRRHYDNIRNGRLCDCNDEDASIISTYLSTRKEFLAARRCFVRNPKARLEPGCPVHTRECLDLGLIAHRGKRRHSCARLNRTLAHSCIDRLQEGSLSMDDCEGYRSFHEEFDNIILAIKRYILKCDGCNLSDLMELCLKDQDGRHPAICRRMVLSRDTVNCVMDRVTGSDSDCSKVELLVRATMEQQLAVNTAFYNRICKPVDDYLKERAGWSCDNPDGSPS